MGSMFLNVDDVCQILCVQKSKAYQVIKDCNSDLKNKGYFVVRGKVPKAYLYEKIYGSNMEAAQ